MKRYKIDVHYTMVISNIEVIADDEQSARLLAQDKAATMPLEAMECTKQTTSLCSEEEVDSRETCKLENEKFAEFLKHWFAAYDDPTDIGQKWTLYEVTTGVDKPCWAAAIKTDSTQWERDFWQNIQDGTHPRMEAFERYTKLYGRKVVAKLYGRRGKSLFRRIFNH